MTEQEIRRLINRHMLERVEIITRDGKTFTVIAYPAHWHRIIGERRQAAFAAALKKKADLSIAEAEEIAAKAALGECARAEGALIAETVAALSAKLETL